MRRLSFPVESRRPLSEQLSERLSSLLQRPVPDLEVSQLLAQGSVYRDKVRLRNPGPPGSGPDIEVFFPELPIVEFTLDSEGIFWQDEHLLVAYKPAGVNTAPSPFSDRDCLSWGVQKHLGEGFAIHAVHRLDRDTQGLVLFAKHKEAELGLHRLFRDRKIRKVYRAITPAAEGTPPPTFRWRDTLEWRGKVQTAATTAIYSRTDSRGRWVWSVLPHTGRPHQIRKHFSQYLMPLWGDQVYAPGVYDRGESLGLACVAYRFCHPMTGQRLSLDAEGETGDKGRVHLPPSSSG